MAKDELEESDGTYAESGTPRPSGRAPADRSQEKPELPETTETAVSTQTEKDVSTQPKEYEQSEAEWEHTQKKASASKSSTNQFVRASEEEGAPGTYQPSKQSIFSGEPKEKTRVEKVKEKLSSENTNLGKAYRTLSNLPSSVKAKAGQAKEAVKSEVREMYEDPYAWQKKAAGKVSSGLDTLSTGGGLGTALMPFERGLQMTSNKMKMERGGKPVTDKRGNQYVDPRTGVPIVRGGEGIYALGGSSSRQKAQPQAKQSTGKGKRQTRGVPQSQFTRSPINFSTGIGLTQLPLQKPLKKTQTPMPSAKGDAWRLPWE